MDNEEIIYLSVIIGAATLLLTDTSRKWWVRPWIERREQRKGHLHLVHEEFYNDDDKGSFKNFLRMNRETFDRLLDMIKEKIEKKDTILRESISARARLTITLRYLATGESYKSLSYAFRVGHSTIAEFVPEVCTALYDALKGKYLKVPNTAAEWLNIADDFNTKWNFPNTLGAMDGKHICFRAPRSAGSTCYNYKQNHSIVLLAVVDAHYNFIYVDVGTNGRISDGGVFRKSDLTAAINANTLNIPEDSALPGRNLSVPFVLVADAAFPLSTHIMKPFPFRNMTCFQRIYNYRLSRARRVVENAFGILANRFRLLLNTINLAPEKVQLLTLTCCALHNYLKSLDKNYGIPENDIDRRYTFKYGLSAQSGNRSTTSSLQNRQEFLEYVNGPGAVSWQNNV